MTALPLLSSSNLQQRLIVALSFVQGILIYLLYKAVDSGHWPNGHPVPLYLLATLLIGAPLFCNLLLDKGPLKRVLFALAPLIVIAVLVATYRGLQVLPAKHGDDFSLLPFYIFTLIIVGFKLTIYAQQWVRGEKFAYVSLLHNSWRLFLHMAFSALFTLLLHLVLLLWGGLFDLIGIGIFRFVFRQSWFVIPLTTTAFGFALILFSNLDHIIETVTRLLVTLLRFLLPLLAFVCVLFIAFLPFTGLQGLWDAKVGSLLLLWLMALMLFFTNAVFQPSADPTETPTHQPYSRGLQRLIAIAVATLPVFGILALHGLFTRIAQYGLTVDRLYGLIVVFILLGFALGYLWSVVRLRDHWLNGLQRINVVMGLVVLAVTLATNTPLLNVQRWSAHSQLARLERGLALNELDLNYFRRFLGSSGYAALMELSQRVATNEPALATRIERLYQSPISTSTTIDDFNSLLTLWPASRELPPPVVQSILDTLNQSGLGKASDYRRIYALFEDLNEDGNEEIVVLLEQNAWYQPLGFWSLHEGVWQKHFAVFKQPLLPPALDTLIQQSNIHAVPQQWQQLQIGDSVLVPQE